MTIKTEKSPKEVMDGNTSSENARGAHELELKSSHSNTSATSEDEWHDLPEDVYNLGFVSEYWGEAFYYAFYICALKLSFFTFLIVQGIKVLRTAPKLNPTENSMLLAIQFLMLPVAIAIQDDLISTIFIVCNLKYDEKIEEKYPCATKFKFYLFNIFRGIDGFYSLAVNFVVLLTAQNILGVFLNFAALLFLTSIDNMALELACSGYLTDSMEDQAHNAKEARLPRNHNKLLRSMDSVLFFVTLIILIIVWCIYHFALDD